MAVIRIIKKSKDLFKKEKKTEQLSINNKYSYTFLVL
jgi:hypothetical protein